MATAQELATDLYNVRSEMADLKEREADLVERLAAEMTEPRLEIPGMGVFERQWGKERKAWDHNGMRREILKAVRDGRAKPMRLITDDGEIVQESQDELAMRVLSECAGISYWGKNACKAIDIDVDEHCESKPGKLSIRFHGNLEGGEA